MNELVYRKNEYNGWKNYETWNVMLYINNDIKTYSEVKFCYSKFSKSAPYDAWLVKYGKQFQKTPDNVQWGDKKIDLDEVNEHLCEMFSNEE